MSNLGLSQITFYAADSEEMDTDANTNESPEILSEEEEETPDLAEMLTRRHTKTKVFSGSKAKSIMTTYKETCSKKIEKITTKEEHDWKVRCGRDFNVKKKRSGETWIEVYARLDEEKNAKLQPLINEISERAESRKLDVKKVKVLATLPGRPFKKNSKLNTPIREEMMDKVGSLKQKDQRQNEAKLKPKSTPKRGPAPLMKKSIKAARAMQMRYRR